MRTSILLLLLFAALVSLTTLIRQFESVAHESPLEFASLVLVYWSPYLALALLSPWLGRRPVQAGILLTGTALVALWGVYWHLEVFVWQPSLMSQLVSPLLITGNQWMGVVLTASLTLVAGWIAGRKARQESGGEKR